MASCKGKRNRQEAVIQLCIISYPALERESGSYLTRMLLIRLGSQVINALVMSSTPCSSKKERSLLNNNHLLCVIKKFVSSRKYGMDSSYPRGSGWSLEGL